MARRYMQLMLTPDVQAAQDRYFGRHSAISNAPERDPLTPQEAEFIEACDSFFLATVNSDGWPYIQHRGGPAGFLKVIGPHLLGFADLKGNRQMLTTGNLAGNDRVSLFLIDYPNRTRLKILGRARVVAPDDDADLTQRLTPAPELRDRVERLIVVEVAGYDWNCSQYITPRYTEAEWNDRRSTD